MEAEVVHESIDYDALMSQLSKKLVDESLPWVQDEVFWVLEPHRITGETGASIRTRETDAVPQPKEGAVGEVYTDVEWAEVLEYTSVPFMRLGARRARNKVRALIKPIFGDLMRGSVGLRKRRRR